MYPDKTLARRKAKEMSAFPDILWGRQKAPGGKGDNDSSSLLLFLAIRLA
jgi:hypothetical protein